jgi:hypothetical protein
MYLRLVTVKTTVHVRHVALPAPGLALTAFSMCAIQESVSCLSAQIAEPDGTQA